MTGRSALDVLLVCLAGCSLALAAGIVFAPELLPQRVVASIIALERAIDPGRAAALAVLVVGGFALWRTYASGATDVRDGFVDRDPAESSVSGEVVGAASTERARETVDALKRGRDAPTGAVLEDLREAIVAVETARGRSRSDAIERVDRGAWTDDPVAAAFVGDASAGTLSLRCRLVAWMLPGWTFDRRLERTVAAVERYSRRAPDSRRHGDGGRGRDDETERVGADRKRTGDRVSSRPSTADVEGRD